MKTDDRKSEEKAAEVAEAAEADQVVELSEIRGTGRAARRRRKRELSRTAAQGRKRLSNKGRINELQRQFFTLLGGVREQFAATHHVLEQMNERLLRVESVVELLARMVREGEETLTDEEMQAVQEFVDGGPPPKEGAPTEEGEPADEAPSKTDQD